MISNAKDRNLFDYPGTMPDLGEALLDLFQRMVFNRIRKRTINHELVETNDQVSAQGVRQPLEAQKIAMKPEGQRAWRWEQIHATPALVLEIDDQITFGGLPYRVAGKWDWKEYGFVEYHICQDYKT